MDETLYLAIIIINYNSYENTFKCIKSITDSSPVHSYKIYIVDNGSTNNSFEYLKKEYNDDSKICILQSPDNLGYSGGLNYGIRCALADECKYYLLCNNDLIFPNGSIDALIDANETYQDAGVIGGRIVGMDDLDQKSYKYRMSYRDHLSEKKPFLFFIKSKKNSLPMDRPSFFDGMVSGACFQLSKKTIEKIGLLDENIFLFYEEDALAYKLKNASLQALFMPTVKIKHFGSTTIGTNGVVYYLNRYKSSMYVLKKYVKINNIQLGVVYISNWFSLNLKALHDPKYKEAIKNLKDYYHILRGMSND